MAKSKIATAYVQVMPSMEGVAPKVSSYFGGAGKTSGASFGGNLISTIKTALATAGIGQALKTTILEGADLQQSLGGVETLFKDSAAQIIENANNAYRTAGMSANGYMETVTSFSASLLQGLGRDTQKAASVADMALTDMSDNANKMGTSMELIQNAYQGFAKQNYTMLDNLKLGYGGTKTEMQRLLTDAQKWTGIEYDIDNLADVYSAIHAIQGKMEISGRTAEEAAEIFENTGRVVSEQLGTTAKESANTLSGSFNSMKAAFFNVLGKLTLGEDMKPSLEALADTTKTFLLGNLVPAVRNIFTALPGSVSTLLHELIPENVEGVVNTAITGFTEFVTSNLPFVMDSGIETLTTFIGGITQVIPTLSTSASQILGTLKTYLTDSANLEGLLSAGGDLLGTIAVGIINVIGTLATTALDVLSALGKYLTDPENLAELLKKAGEIGGQIANAIWNNLKSVWDRLKENFPSLLDGIKFGVNATYGGSSGLALSTPGFAKGLDYVPYDNFLARLHEGEMVLTKSQANAVRRGSMANRGVTVIQHIYSEAKSAADLMEEARYKQEEAELLGI